MAFEVRATTIARQRPGHGRESRHVNHHRPDPFRQCWDRHDRPERHDSRTRWIRPTTGCQAWNRSEKRGRDVTKQSQFASTIVATALNDTTRPLPVDQTAKRSAQKRRGAATNQSQFAGSTLVTTAPNGTTRELGATRPTTGSRADPIRAEL
jgi:hypothetical protein